MTKVDTSLAEKLRRVSLTVGHRLNELLGGDYSSLRLGNGFEFSHMRDYVEGDDIRMINQRALAQDPFHPRVNVMQRDSSVTGWVITDCGPNMNFGSVRARKSDVALETTAAFGHLLTKRGNRYGAVLVSNNGLETIMPRQQRYQLEAVVGRQHLTESPDGEDVELVAGLRRFRALQLRRSVCIVISDFRTPGWERELKLIAEKHVLYKVQVVDPQELRLSGDSGVNNLRKPSSNRRFRGDITSKVAKEYTKLAQAEQDRIRLELLKSGARLIELHTDEDYLGELILALKQPRRRTYVRNR